MPPDPYSYAASARSVEMPSSPELRFPAIVTFESNGLVGSAVSGRRRRIAGGCSRRDDLSSYGNPKRGAEKEAPRLGRELLRETNYEET